MRINHNSLALNASDNLARVNQNIQKSMARLSSGYKITDPSDDAAGLAISLKMNAQIRGLGRAEQNTNDGVSVIQSAEGGLSEIQSVLARMRELAVQATSDVNSEEDRDAIQDEINALRDEIDQIVETTAFNEQTLLNGDLTRRTLSDQTSVQATYVSSSVNVGTYTLQVTSPATKAMMTTGLKYSTATITAAQAGTLKVNNFDVEITEGMTMTDVYETLQEHLSKIGIDVMSTKDGETERKFTSGTPVMFVSKEYGSDQKIEISSGNKELLSVLGLTDGQKTTGKDCKAALTVTDEGFSTTATLTTKGNEITVIDRNGFEMKIDTDPVELKKTGKVTANIEVLSAGTMIIQTGDDSGEQLSIDIPSVNSKSLDVDNLIMYTHDYAADAIEKIDAAVKMVSNIRSKLGAYQNRLEDMESNLAVQGESLTEAYSRIMDTDMAEEMTVYTQENVLSQAAISMIQKSNERPESILQLLQ